MAAEAGQLELNAFEPVIFYTLFESIETLGHAAQTLTDNCILGITANEKHCKDLVNASAGIATALCPSIGYAASAALAKESLKTNVAVRTLAVTKGYVTEAEADKLLDPYTMTGQVFEALFFQLELLNCRLSHKDNMRLHQPEKNSYYH